MMFPRKLGACLLVLALLAAGCGGGKGSSGKRGQPARQALVVVLSATQEGRLACVQDLVRQRMSINEALAECATKLPSVDIGRRGGESGLGLTLPGGVGAGTVPVSGSCPSPNIDPRLARDTRRPTPAEKKYYDLDDTQKMYTEEARQRMLEERQAKLSETGKALRATEEYKAMLAAWDAQDKVDADPNSTPEQKAEAQKKVDEAEKKLWETKEGRDHQRANEKATNVPVATPPLVSRTDPNAYDACEEMLRFISECNDNGWKRPDCQLFLARLKGCGDPRVTDPRPEAGEAEPSEGGGCGLPAVDPEEVERVATLACQKVTRPVPGEEPCGPLKLEGRLHRFALGRRGPPCGNPLAITDPDQCTPGITVVKFGRTLSQSDLDKFRSKFGGPVIYLPKSGGPSPGPGPDPEPGPE